VPRVRIGLQWLVRSALFLDFERRRRLPRSVDRNGYREGVQFQSVRSGLRGERYLSGWPALLE
jgi:hypothetical protein